MSKHKLELVKKAGNWSGYSKFPGCATTFGPYKTRTGKWYTGLTKEDVARLSAATGIEEAALMPPSEVEGNIKQGSYWKNWAIRVTSAGVLLDTSDPYDEIRYLFLKGHPWVAVGTDAKNSTHKFVLLNVEQEAITNNEKNKTKRQVATAVDKMDVGMMRAALRVLGIDPSQMSDVVVESELNKEAFKNPSKFVSAWINNKDREFEDFLEQLVQKQIIRKNKTAYIHGTETIGNGKQDAIAYL